MHPWSVGVLAGLVACRPSQVPITVQNGSGQSLHRVVLAGSGFTDTLAEVAAGQSVTVRVRPRGESGLALRFLAGGRQIDFPAKGYFEGTGGYVVKATIDSSFSVDVSSTLR
jgi:hypothetical protein